MNNNSHLHPYSRYVHHEKVVLPIGNTPLVSPIYQSVKYKPAHMEHLRNILSRRNVGFLYSRAANPTVRELEILLANIQGTEDGLATATGVGALTAVAMTFLKAGDHTVLFTESYKPTRFLLDGILANFGVQTTRVDRDDYKRLESLFSSENPPKVIFFESPTNPTLRIHDIQWITTLAKKHNCLTVLDNTFAGFERHKHAGIDIFVHSLTKLASGHSDAMGGVILANKDNIEAISPIAITLGSSLDPHSAWLISRGMKTFGLRTQASSSAALQIATWLTSQPWAIHVRYPALKSHPDHNLWLKQNDGDGGSLITFDLNCKPENIDRFFDALRLFAVTPSVGCVESLAAPCYLFFGTDLGVEQAAKVGITERTIRLSIGIEDVSDLQQDLLQAADAAI